MIPIVDVEPDASDKFSFSGLAEAAERFLLQQTWCDAVKSGYLGYGCEGIVGVFFFEIIPSRPNVDEQLWVVVGDVPPAYLVCDKAPRPSLALRGYIDEMKRWVDAVQAGRPVDELIPVCYQNTLKLVPPTVEFAEMLGGRLSLLEQNVLPDAQAAEA